MSEKRLEQQSTIAERVATYPGTIRAAVVIAMLGEGAAKPIVEKLDDQALREIAVALDGVRLIAREDLVAIVMDFLGLLRGAAAPFLGGRAHARELVESIVTSRMASLEVGATEVAQTGSALQGSEPDTLDSKIEVGEFQNVWNRIGRFDAEKTAQYFNHLPANLTAMAFRKLSNETLSRLFAYMNDDHLTEVLDHLVTTDATDEGLVQIVARMIEIELLQSGQGDDEADKEQLAELGELLSLVPTEKRRKLVDFLKAQHGTKLDQIQKSLVTLEALPDLLPRNVVPLLVRETEPKMMTRFLSSIKDDYAPVFEFILSNISSRMADQLRDDIAAVAPPSVEEADAVQREFLSKVMAMKRSGTIASG